MPGRTDRGVGGNRIVVRAVEEMGPIVDVGRYRFCKLHKAGFDIGFWMPDTGHKFFVSVGVDNPDSSWSEDPIYFLTRGCASGIQDHQQIDQIVNVRQILTAEHIDRSFSVDAFRLNELLCRFDLLGVRVQSLDQVRSGPAELHEQPRVVAADADDEAASDT